MISQEVGLLLSDRGNGLCRYSTTSKVFAKSFPTKKSALLATTLVNNHGPEKHVAFSGDYIAYIHEFSDRSVCLILGILSFGLNDCLNPPLHTPYKII